MMKTTTVLCAFLLVASGVCAKDADAAAVHKAYARKVAAELRRHSPKVGEQHGTLTVRFTIGASGRVVSHEILTSSNPALAPEVEKVLASINAPQPPGGSFTAKQNFVFH